jgi:hypothetical protein
MSADLNATLTIAAVLWAIELGMIAILKCSTSQLKKTFDRELNGRILDKLSAVEQEAAFSCASEKHFKTVYRKLELFVIAYHLPALASWVSLTRKTTTPGVIYFGITFLFWFAVSMLVRAFLK